MKIQPVGSLGGGRKELRRSKLDLGKNAGYSLLKREGKEWIGFSIKE